jgi:hypothetical protein
MLSDAFGAEGLPKGLALALAAVSTLIAVRALQAHRRWRRAQPAPAAETKTVSDPHLSEAKTVSDPHLLAEGKRVSDPHFRALGVVAIGFGYVVLAPWIGFLPAVSLLIGAAALYYGAKPGAAVGWMSIGGGVVLWLVFARMLGVSMPAGLWARFLG